MGLDVPGGAYGAASIVLVALPRPSFRVRSYPVGKPVLCLGPMDREPAGVMDAEPRPAAARGPRRRRAAVVVVGLVLAALVAVIAVLATRLGVASSASPAATPRPTATATASPSVSAIYQRVRPSV